MPFLSVPVSPGSPKAVAGPRTRPAQELLAPGTMVVGVRFQPGAAPAVLGASATELLDMSIGLDAMWGLRADRLADQLAAAAGPATIKSILERELGMAMAAAPPSDPVVERAVKALMRNAIEVADLPKFVDLSARQLLRRFVAAVGYGPKTLHRILRFQRLLAAAHAGVDDGLAVLAHDLGYADQAHLTYETRRLTGMSPGLFLAEVRESCNASHDHRVSQGRTLGPARTSREK